MRTKLPSLTARWVTLLRAISNENPLLNDFSDPIALRLLSPKMIRIAQDGAKRLDQKGTFPEFLRHAALQVQFRTVVIDYAIRKNRPFNQLVILGAGLDSRAWRMQELNNVKVYEVDHPATQAWKKEQVKKIEGERQAEEVKFVAVDFTKDDLSLKLEEAGFDRKKKSFWIWEGVTMY